jgi:metal transporter CNNM
MEENSAVWVIIVSNVGDILTTLTLLGFSALFSGLTLGLLSLSPQELKRKMELGSREAALIYPLREKGNQLLVTLLIGNVLVNSMFSIFLGNLTSGLIAVVASTVLITLFGEIIPQAVLADTPCGLVPKWHR